MAGGGLEVGAIFARLGARLDDSEFDRFERRYEAARRLTSRDVVADLRANDERAGFERFDRNVQEARRETARPVTQELRADTNTRGFEQYNRAARETRDNNAELVRGSARLRGSFASLAVGGAGIGAAVIGIGALGRALKDSVTGYQDHLKVARQSAIVIKSTGGVAGVTAKQVTELSNALEAKTAVDGDVIQSGANMLLTFTNVRNEAGRGNDVFNQATKTLVDMSAALGTDASTSAIGLGKALNDPIKGVTALQRVGVTFTEQQKTQIKTLVESGRRLDAQKMILRELNKEFGGSAAKNATATGKLTVAFHALQDTVGRALLPVIESAAYMLTDFVEGLQGAASKGGALRTMILGISAAIGDIVPPVIKGVRTIVSTFGDIIRAFRGGNADATRLASNVGRTFSAIIAAGRRLYTSLSRTFDGVGSDLRDIARGFAKVMATVEDVIQPVVRSVLPGLTRAVEGIAQVVRSVVRTVAAIFRGDFAEAWRGLKGIVSGAIKAVVGVLEAAVSAIATAAYEIGSKIVSGIIDVLKGLPGASLKLLRELAGKVGDLGEHFKKNAGNIATGIVTGIVSGLTGLAPSIVKAGQDLGRKLINAVKGFLGIKSPSREFMKIGGHIVDGLAQGLNAGDVATVARKAFGGFPKLAKDLLVSGAIDITDVPFKALSKVAGGIAGLGSKLLGKLGLGGGGGLDQWLALALQITGHYTPANFEALKGRALQESGGNPRAINLWDSNAKAGYPSRGLLQTIPQTFAAYRDPSLPNDIYNPVANAVAAINYMMARYGHIVGPSSTGYRTGGKFEPGGKVGPGSGGVHIRVAGEGSADEWIISQEGDRQANIGYALDALQTLTGGRVSFNRAGSGRRKAKVPTPKLTSKANAGIQRSLARGRKGIAGFEERIQDLEKKYDQAQRIADLDDPDIVIENEDGSTSIDEKAKADTLAELTDLRSKRDNIGKEQREYRRKAEAAIKAYRQGIKTLQAARKAAKGKARAKERAGYTERIKAYQGRIGELKGVVHDLGFDITDNDIDLKEIDAEIGAIDAKKAGAAPAKEPDAPSTPSLDDALTADEAKKAAEINRDVAVASTTADTADDEAARKAGESFWRGVLDRLQQAGAAPEVIQAAAESLAGFLKGDATGNGTGTTTDQGATSNTPDPLEIARQAFAEFTSFLSTRADLLGSMGSNIAGAGQPGAVGPGAAGGARYFGWQGAGGGVPQVVVEQLDQHYPQAPENPDAWKTRVAFTTTALVAGG